MSKRSKEHFRATRETSAPLSRHSMNQRIAGISISGDRKIFQEKVPHVKRLRRLSQRMVDDSIKIGQMDSLLNKGFKGEKLTKEEMELLDFALAEHEECVDIFEHLGKRVTVTIVDLTELTSPFVSFGEPGIFRKERP